MAVSLHHSAPALDPHAQVLLQALTEATNKLGGRWLVTADHGNAEGMVSRDKKGSPVMDDEGHPIPLTSHTLSPVRAQSEAPVRSITLALTRIMLMQPVQPVAA